MAFNSFQEMDLASNRFNALSNGQRLVARYGNEWAAIEAARFNALRNGQRLVAITRCPTSAPGPVSFNALNNGQRLVANLSAE